MKTTELLILVVEDEPMDRLMFEEAFKSNATAAKVHFCENGADAIHYIEGDGQFSDRSLFPYPSIVLTDLKMPKVNGFELLAHFKNDPFYAMIPRIVLTSSEDPDDIQKAYGLGASSYHVKPANYNQLQELVKCLCEYWRRCEVPARDNQGRPSPTRSKGKLGEKFFSEGTHSQS